MASIVRQNKQQDNLSVSVRTNVLCDMDLLVYYSFLLTMSIGGVPHPLPLGDKGPSQGN